MKRLQDINTVQARNISKGQLAKELLGDTTYDTAIPQNLCNLITDKCGYNASSELVMAYDDDRFSFGILIPLTSDMAKVLLDMSSDKLSTVMNWDSLGIEYFS